MPNELETRTTDAGRQVFLKGEWKDEKENKAQPEGEEYPLEITFNISGTTYSGRARTMKGKDVVKDGEVIREGRNMVAIKLDNDQPLYGGASFFLRV